MNVYSIYNINSSKILYAKMLLFSPKIACVTKLIDFGFKKQSLQPYCVDAQADFPHFFYQKSEFLKVGRILSPQEVLPIILRDLHAIQCLSSSCPTTYYHTVINLKIQSIHLQGRPL